MFVCLIKYQRILLATEPIWFFTVILLLGLGKIHNYFGGRVPPPSHKKLPQKISFLPLFFFFSSFLLFCGVGYSTVLFFIVFVQNTTFLLFVEWQHRSANLSGIFSFRLGDVILVLNGRIWSAGFIKKFIAVFIFVSAHRYNYNLIIFVLKQYTVCYEH